MIEINTAIPERPSSKLSALREKATQAARGLIQTWKECPQELLTGTTIAFVGSVLVGVAAQEYFNIFDWPSMGRAWALTFGAAGISGEFFGVSSAIHKIFTESKGKK